MRCLPADLDRDDHNAERADWLDDISIPNAKALGLLIPSKVRTAKIAAVETAAATRIARLDAETTEKVLGTIRKHLDIG